MTPFTPDGAVSDLVIGHNKRQLLAMRGTQ